MEAKEQAQLFDKAARLFQKREYGRARELYQRAAGGPAADMAHAALMRVRMCERRLSQEPVVLKTAEDHYTYGVTLMNQGDLERAEQLLRQALSQETESDHFHYALALCTGLRGDLEAAARHLRKAIEIEPQNRALALKDTEFRSLLQHEALRVVVHPERSASG